MFAFHNWPATRPGTKRLAGTSAILVLLTLSTDLTGAGQHIAASDVIASAARGDAQLATFYARRGNKPLWPSSQDNVEAAQRLLRVSDFSNLGQAFQIGQTHSALDIYLSKSLVAYVRSRRSIPADQRPVYVDAELAPDVGPSSILEEAVRAPSLRQYLNQIEQGHPILAALQRRQAANPQDSAIYQPAIAQAHALPIDGRKHIVVDTASARLWLYDGGRVVDTMRVVVGKRDLPTPALVGLIRYAVLNPYWNLPPDLIRVRAAAIAGGDTSLLTRERLEVLSDWTETAHRIDPGTVDWSAVAAGRTTLRLRQLPGPGNMMGRVKFMLPNRLGIYLHDTPNRSAFALTNRRLSSGCVRVEDANRLLQWLQAEAQSTGEAEQRVALGAAVPVYILHLDGPAQGRSRDGAI